MATDSSAVLRTVSVLLGQEPEVVSSFLMAAVYVEALRREVSPRTVVDSLFSSLPSDSAWPALAVALAGIGEDGPV